MAKQMKTLNGYEIVDQSARTSINTKQNKVLYGDSDPSSSTGTTGDLYISFNTTAIKNEIINLLYPVGSVITNSNASFNPNTEYSGTTWVRIKGKVIVGVDENDTTFKSSGLTGGEKAHTLTIAEMPTHTHKYLLAYGGTDPAIGFNYGNTLAGQFGSTADDNNFIKTIGNNQSHNNLQPYITKYVWERTA